MGACSRGTLYSNTCKSKVHCVAVVTVVVVAVDIGIAGRFNEFLRPTTKPDLISTFFSTRHLVN